MRHRRFLAGSFVCLVLWLGPDGAAAGKLVAAADVTWVMLNVNTRGPQQGDAHLVTFPGRHTVLIDTGMPGQDLVRLLRARRVSRLDQVVITHAHKDHYGGLRELLGAKLPIGEVFFNVPDQPTCDREIPWGCDFQDIQRLISELREARVPVRTAGAGTSIVRSSPDIRLDVMFAVDQATSPTPNIDINDMSLILRLQVGGVRALFTGDLNHPLGTYLATQGRRPEFQAVLLKIPHHGAESTAPNAFFDLVGPKVALVPAPRALWESQRCARVRGHLDTTGVTTFVNGLHGDVSVEIRTDRFTIFTGGSKAPAFHHVLPGGGQPAGLPAPLAARPGADRPRSVAHSSWSATLSMRP